jgi:integrase
VEAVEVDPVGKIRKMAEVAKIKTVPTDNERVKINEHLLATDPDFYRFTHIFFHAGCRISELLRVKKEDIDLSGQRFKVTIIKGKRKMQVWKVIKTIALSFWKEINCPARHYIFAQFLRPGTEPINPKQIYRRWKKKVMEPLGITATIYSLKHLHSTQIVDIVTSHERAIRKAAEHNSHADGSMVTRVYDIKGNQRENDEVKDMANAF